MMEFLKKHDWLGHIVEALVMTSGIGLVTAFTTNLATSYCLLLSGAFAVGHFHGREKRDCEVRLHMQPPHLDAYKFWLWNKDELTDFFPVLAIYLAFFAYCLFGG